MDVEWTFGPTQLAIVVLKNRTRQHRPTHRSGNHHRLMEAMKIEHTIKAEHAGVVTELHFSAGEQVEGGVLIARVEEKSWGSREGTERWRPSPCEPGGWM